MNILKALPLLKQGKLIRRQSWAERNHLGLDEEGLYWSTNPPQEGFYISIDAKFSLEDIEAEDWEILIPLPDIRCRRVLRADSDAWDNRLGANKPIHALSQEELLRLVEESPYNQDIVYLTPETKEGLAAEVFYRVFSGDMGVTNKMLKTV